MWTHRYSVRSKGGLLLLATAVAGIMLSAPGGSFADDRQLGEVQLSLQQGSASGEEKTSPAPQLAVLLIDCSLSMTWKLDGTQQVRWDAMRQGVERLLDSLLPPAGEPPILVRLVFFATNLNCLPPQSRVLATQADVVALMESIPRSYPKDRIDRAGGGMTHYYESLVKTLEQVRAENGRRKHAWLLFSIYSDGKDETSPSGFDLQRVEALVSQLGRELPVFVYKAWTIGAQADAAAKSGQYGSAGTLRIDEKPPQLPKPKPRFAIGLAAGQPAAIKAESVASPGVYRLPIRVAGAEQTIVQSLELAAAIEGQSPFKVRTGGVALDASGCGFVELELSAGGSPERGLATTLAFTPATKAGSNTIFEGAPRVTLSFPSSKTLPVDAWTMRYDREVKRGDATTFFVNPGQYTAPKWTFRSPDGSTMSADDVAVSKAFTIPGPWAVEFSCTADDGKNLKKIGEPVQVVDADFQLDPPSVMVGEGVETAITITPAKGTPAETNYTAFFNGQEVPVDGLKVRIAKEKLEGFGRNILDVVARYQPKSSADGRPFTWEHGVPIIVNPRPRIALYPDEFVEGCDLGMLVQVRGDLGNAVVLLADGKEVANLPSAYQADSQVHDLPKITIPWKSIARQTIALEARPGKAGACPAEKVSVTARPAEVSARLKAPVEGEEVPSGDSVEIVVEPVGKDRDAVGDIEFVLALESHGKRLPETLSVRRSTGWKAMLPATLPTGPVDVLAKPTGGTLDPKLFPTGKDFSRAGGFIIGMPDLDIVQVSTAGTMQLGKATAPPGKPLTFQLDGRAIGRVRSIEWSIGPLAHDPDLSTAVRRAGTKEEARGQSITPKAWGELPVKATATLYDGTVVTVSREATIAGASPEAAPRLEPRHVFRLGDKTATLRPNITGDSPAARWALVEKGAAAAVDAWTSFTPAEGEQAVGLPTDHFPGRSKDFEVLLEVDRYPEDPNHAPLGYRLPLLLKARSRWPLLVAYIAILGWLTYKLLRWLDNPPLSWELLYGFDDKSTSYDHRENHGERLSISSLGASSDLAPEPPLGLDVRRGVRVAAPLAPARRWKRGSKTVQIPLWKFAEACNDPRASEWLWEAQYANEIIELTTARKSLFARAPRGTSLFGHLPGKDGDGARAWREPQEMLEAKSDHSLVYRLRSRETSNPQRRSRPMWVCAKMNPGGDPLWWWVILPWAVFCFTTVALLTPVLNVF